MNTAFVFVSLVVCGDVGVSFFFGGGVSFWLVFSVGICPVLSFFVHVCVGRVYYWFLWSYPCPMRNHPPNSPKKSQQFGRTGCCVVRDMWKPLLAGKKISSCCLYKTKNGICGAKRIG